MTTRIGKSMTAAIGVSILAISLSGCAHIRQARDHVDPIAVPQMRYEQTLNPDAGKNRRAVAGLEATAAANAYDGYSKSFIRSPGTSTQGFQGTEGLGSN
jgi:hypothetical protein